MTRISKIMALTAVITLVFGIVAIDNAVAGEKRGTYLIIWELDQTKISIDPKERAAGYVALMAMVRKDHERGIATSWGRFIGDPRGYTLLEGTELEVMLVLEQYVPFVTYKVYPIASMSRVNEMIKAMLSK